jgi:predicted lipid-binding transport protein (Tim44 family)
VAAALLTTVLAAAGGGSSGFGGGGGGGFSGGGGGGFSGGSGSGVYVGGGAVSGWIVLAVVLVIFGFILFGVLSTWLMVRRLRRRLDERDRHVRLAAVEAAQDDAAFDPDRLTQDVTVMFHAIQGAWDARDEHALATLVGEDLMVEWHRRLADFAAKGWHNRVRVISGPHVRYVGLTNRERDADDRAVVHVEATLEDYVESGDGTVLRSGDTDTVNELREFWTLAKRGGRWTLVSIEQPLEGAHQLDAPVIASPWSDARVRDAAVVEGAMADAAPAGYAPGELVSVSLSDDAYAQALDLALADGRFAPDVLEVSARRAAEAWADAVDGDDAPLEAVASAEAVAALLYGGDATRRTRLVVRGPRVEQLEIEQLDAHAAPARMTLAVRVRGRRYVEDRDTAAVLGGSKDREIGFTERWTMALDGPPELPWRLEGVAAVPA